MKKLFTILTLLGTTFIAQAQPYSMSFTLQGATDSVMYIARHFRDQVEILDSARGVKGTYLFKGKRSWPRGIYALVGQKRDKGIRDFVIDGSQKFSVTGDATLSPASVTVKGSDANQQMFNYLKTVESAKKELNDIRKRQKNPADKEQADKEEKALIERMEAFDASARHPKKPQFFFDLVNLFDEPEVPDSIEDKSTYFRTHYWDRLLPKPENARYKLADLRHTPNLFNKVNYFFFGLMYYADSDTICKEIDRLAARIGDDTAMLRYIFDFIEPRYYRSTRNIGWDAVWCHLQAEYYQKGRCPWVSEGNLYNMRHNFNRIRQSIIGAHGQELWMADTNQSSDPKDWVSSHRFPTKYVILWFWDPDCHHCQEQSAALKVLYDSLLTAPYRPFEVYAVGYESDVEKWKKYVREHDFRWVNVGGPNVNIDYQEAYNVHGAPTMIILNERRDIIMNKVLPAKNLLKFFEDYEKKKQKQN